MEPTTPVLRLVMTRDFAVRHFVEVQVWWANRGRDPYVFWIVSLWRIVNSRFQGLSVGATTYRLRFKVPEGAAYCPFPERLP
jgi:hypothetical protein